MSKCSDFVDMFETEAEAIAFEFGVLAGVNCKKDPIGSDLCQEIYGVHKGTVEEPSSKYWEWLIAQIPSVYTTGERH
jgi:hypothetical protein